MNNRVKVQYELQRRRNRKRISLRVTDDATVLVVAPLRTPLTVIEEVVIKHSPWITAKLTQVKQLPPSLPPLTYTTGDRLLVLEEECTLQIEHGGVYATTCIRQGSTLIVKTRKGSGVQAIRKALLGWYVDFGKQLYHQLVTQWMSQIEETPNLELASIEIAFYPKRWGSCSQKGELRFALRSLMLPYPIVNYLALHEVAHLYYFNHGQEFKCFLDTYMSDWKERQKTMNRLRRQAVAF